MTDESLADLIPERAITVAAIIGAVLGLIGGGYIGFDIGGIGGALIFGIVGGAIGGAVGALVLPAAALLLQGAIVIGAIALVIWLLISLWGVGK